MYDDDNNNIMRASYTTRCYNNTLGHGHTIVRTIFFFFEKKYTKITTRETAA